MSTARENAEAALARYDGITNAHGYGAGDHVRLAHVLRALLAETAPTEWEYALRGDGDDEPYSDYSDDLDWLLDGADLVTGEAHVVRRRKAGPWEVCDG